MKKFTFKNVLDGFRSSVTQPIAKPEHALIEETLRPEFFQIAKTVRHGFPYQPTAIAFDSIQKLLAVGTKHGSIRLIGRPGVDVHMQHENETAVVHVTFLPNAGALVSATQDDSLHLWNFRQKKPEVVHTLKFQRERITCIHLPFQSKFLYVGTERGNIYVVNIEVFQLSGYVINWNKAIELSRKTHPGCVVHLSDCPIDPNKLLIGFESGQIVIWDLKTKTADSRYQNSEPLRSISWHHEGKQFMCSHMDGSLTTWIMRQTSPKPSSIIFPHAKTNKEGKQEVCKPIYKLEWTCCRNGDSFVIFSGGLTNDRAGKTPSITVIHGKTTTVLEMEHNVVDFITLCETPWPNDFAEPYALVVLLHNDLVVVDLHSPGYPCFENPYSMDFHESPVTSCCYIADCPADLIPALYSIGARSQKRSGFSEKEWPISGGKWGSSCSYSELIVTGHADGSLKFWDASSCMVQILYKLKTAKIFEKPRAKSMESGDDDPFAIYHIALCPESRTLCVAGASSHVICFKYCKQENSGEVQCLEIPIVYENCDSSELSPDAEFPPHPTPQASMDFFVPIHVKGGIQKKSPGYQAELVCLTPWVNGEPPGAVSALSLNSSYGLFAYGNENGLVIVDYIQKTCLLSMGTPELYGTADPYQRAPRSPKKPESNKDKDEDRCKSPASDQLNGVCLSPTGSKGIVRRPGSEKNDNLRRSRSQDKLDQSTFSRSRSSSISSLDNITSEAVQCLAFADSYTKKNDNLLCPTLWVGTSLGSVIQVLIFLPSGELRSSMPVNVTPSGTIFRLKGSILAMSFLDCNGALIPYTFESWKDANKEKKLERTPTKSLVNNRMSPTNSSQEQTWVDRQFVVIASDKVARVVALPSHNCVYKQIITEISFVVKSEIIQMKDAVCLVCYIGSGHLSIYSLPSLRQLIYMEFVPLSELRIARTFCFTNYGHGLYLSSQSEIQKFTISADFCKDLQDLSGNLFMPCETPEPPKQSFFKGFFGGGVSQLDRDELFGESSGKAIKSVAKHIPGPNANVEALNARTNTVGGEVAKTRQQLVERGEKLGQLDDKTAKMMLEAENFSHSAHNIMLKQKDKKWYQL